MRKRCAARSEFVIAADVSMDMMIIQNIVKLGLEREHLGFVSGHVPRIGIWKRS